MTLYILEPTSCLFFLPIYTPFLPSRFLLLYPFSAWPSLKLKHTICCKYFKGSWSFIQDMMEVDGRTSHCNENRHFQSSTPLNEHKNPVENTPGTSEFVNHAAIAWEESRRKWTGDISQRSHIMQNDPIISWSTTYEDLLSTNDPFAKPIPLSEMVDFLVDIWHDEDLFD